MKLKELVTPANIITGREGCGSMKIEPNAAFLEHLFESVYVVDKERTILSWNKSAEELTGFSAKEVVGKHCYDNILMHVDDKGKNLCHAGCPLEASLRDGKVLDVSVYLRHKGGHRVPVHVRSVPIESDTGLIHSTVEIFSREGQSPDTEQLRKLARKAFIDSLTGLPNREYIENKLKSLLASGVPGDISQWGLLFIEIDNLRELNQEYGRTAGDVAIRVAATTLRENIEHGEMVARWDASLFLVITTQDKRSLLLNWSNKVKALIEQSRIPGQEAARIEVSVGGIIANMGAVMESIVPALERELKAARDGGNRISIQT